MMNRDKVLQWCHDELTTWPSKGDVLIEPPSGWEWEEHATHGFTLNRIDGVFIECVEFGDWYNKKVRSKLRRSANKNTSMPKQERYLSEDGKDLIDKWADRYSPEEFRLIMFAMMEKYQSRLGKKDSIAKECRKIADYANRLALVEEAREVESTDQNRAQNS